MPFRRRTNALRPVVSDKHEVAWADFGADYSAPTDKLLIDPVLPGAVSASTEVGIGSRVMGIYLEFQVSASAAAIITMIDWYVHFKRTGQTLTSPGLFYQTDRSQILKRGKEMIPADVNTVIKRIIYVRIPRTFQRMQADKKFFISFRSTTSQVINSCGFAIYKEYK